MDRILLLGAGKIGSAMQITTAAGVCTMVDLLRAGELPCKGFVRQEDVPLDMLLHNRFGRYDTRAS